MTAAESSPIVGVVLAAGASRRTGYAKALATIDGETFVGRAVRILKEGGCQHVVVVVAPPHDVAITSAVRRAVLARNPAPERGMLSSLQIGIERALEIAPDAVAVVFVPVDLPLLRSATVERLFLEFRKNGGPLVRPICAGRGGHPVLLVRAAAEAVATSRAASTRAALGEVGTIRDVEIDDPGVLRDLDTPDDVLGAGARPPE